MPDDATRITINWDSGFGCGCCLIVFMMLVGCCGGAVWLLAKGIVWLGSI